MLRTSKNSDFNKISEKLRDELKAKKLQTGQTVQFRFLDSQLNPDPDERLKKGKEFIWRQSDVVVGRDRIKDPYSGDIVDIGVVKEFDKEGNPICDKLYVPLKNNNGFFFVVGGGDVKAEDFYEFLLICNENESNPHRNKNTKPKFKMIDEVKENKARNDADDVLTEMLTFVKESGLAERREMALAFGWDGDSASDVILQRLRTIIKHDPVSFQKIIGNKKDLAIKAVLNDALSKGVITHAPLENKFTFSATTEVIATLDRSDSLTPIDQLMSWIKTNPKGTPVLNNIKKQMKPLEVETA